MGAITQRFKVTTDNPQGDAELGRFFLGFPVDLGLRTVGVLAQKNTL